MVGHLKFPKSKHHVYIVLNIYVEEKHPTTILDKL